MTGTEEDPGVIPLVSAREYIGLYNNNKNSFFLFFFRCIRICFIESKRHRQTCNFSSPCPTSRYGDQTMISNRIYYLVGAQIYQEVIYDLLNPSGMEMKVRQHPQLGM